MMRRLAALLAAPAILAGCASPPANYYTLLAPAAGQAASAGGDGGAGPAAGGGQGARAGAGQGARPEAGPAALAVQVLPIAVPAELDLPQIVVRSGQGRVVPLNGERWAGPLGDQVRAALADGLAGALGVPVTQAAMPAGGAALWRVQVEVRRFDSEPGAQARLEAVWRAAPAQGGSAAADAAPLCEARYVQAVGPGIPDLVEGHQRNLARLSQVIASAIGAAAQAGGVQCP